MYPETFEAQVTEDEIQKAGTTIAECPIALACKPHFPRNAIIQVFSDWLRVDRKVYEPSPCQNYDMAVFTDKYDNDKPVEPIIIDFQRAEHLDQ